MPTESIILRCAAVVAYQTGIVMGLLVPEKTGPLNGEHISTSLRNIELVSGEFYRVTFEKIDAPPLSLDI